MSDERMSPVRGYSAGIPWSLHLRAWDAYAAKYGRNQSAERIAERAGFSVGDLDMFVPGWRDKVSEIAKLKVEVARLKAERESLCADDIGWVVNNLAELGVKVMGRYFFCYKGQSIEYTSDNNHNDHERPMKVRRVFKREFGVRRLTRSYDEEMPGEWELLPQPCRTRGEGGA